MSSLMIDAYVVDTLMRDLVGHDRRPSAFIVYLYLWRRISGSRSGSVHLSHQMIAEATGLSRSSVQKGIESLSRRQLIRARRAFRTATPEYRLVRHWRERDGGD